MCVQKRRKFAEAIVRLNVIFNNRNVIEINDGLSVCASLHMRKIPFNLLLFRFNYSADRRLCRGGDASPYRLEPTIFVPDYVFR